MSAPKPRVQVICKTCRSADVTQDANASWNPALQDYELAGTMDAGYCNRCDGQARLISVPLPDRVAWLQEQLAKEMGENQPLARDREAMEEELTELVWALADPGKMFYLARSAHDALKAALVLVADKLEDWGMDLRQDVSAEEDDYASWRTQHEAYVTTCKALSIEPEAFPEELTHGA